MSKCQKTNRAKKVFISFIITKTTQAKNNAKFSINHPMLWFQLKKGFIADNLLALPNNFRFRVPANDE